MYAHMHTYKYIYTYIYTYMHTHICMHTYTIHVHAYNIYMHKYIYIYIHVHAAYWMSTHLTLWILNSEKVMDTKPRCISVATGWVMGSNCPNPTQAWSWDSSKSDDLC